MKRTLDDFFGSSSSNATSSQQSMTNNMSARRHRDAYHLFEDNEARAVEQKVIAFYDAHKRDLPWRTHATAEQQEQRGYRVLVAEIMSQQTRVETVIKYFDKWMTEWPTLASFAAADIARVNELWAGLGYYRRAANLHAAAQKIVAEHDGAVPQTVEALRALPGVGPYTAGAIASTAFGVRAPLVDGNVTRVLSRLRAVAAEPKRSVKLMWSLAEQLISDVNPSSFNQGLMELGATVCTSKAPRCDACPVADHCLARQEVLQGPVDDATIEIEDLCTLCDEDVGAPSDVTRFPSVASKTKQRVEHVHAAVLRVKEDPDQIVLVQRPSTGLLANLYVDPHFNHALTTPKLAIASVDCRRSR